MKKEAVVVQKVIPCPHYDIEATESWLSDLAAQGLHLEKDGFSMGLGNFLKGPPAQVAYRLVSSGKEPSLTGLLTNEDGTWEPPDREVLRMSQHFGWEYVGKRERFFVYRTADPHPRELHTDPQVQAMALRAVAKWRLLEALLFLPFYFYCLHDIGPTIAATPLYGLSFLLLMVVGCFRFLPEVLALRRLWNRLESGRPMDHHKDWQAVRRGHWLQLGAFWALWGGWFLLCFLYILSGWGLITIPF